MVSNDREYYLVGGGRNLTTEQVSICPACAKHPEVATLVASDLKEGICGACGTHGYVFDPEKFELLRNLIRALIRFHFSEDDYNPHWGGTSIDEVLLGQENPILEVATCDDYQDDLIHRITWEGEIYPDYDKGICLFAGGDQLGGRGIQFSIPETPSSELQTIAQRLERENFHAVEAAMKEVLAQIKDDIEVTVQAGTLWYRGRIGVEERSVHVGWRSVNHVATPYKGPAISALPPPQASAGRTNRQGVSVLYVASEVETALAEIRPHPSHFISVGGFRPRKELRVARFDVAIGPFSSSDARLDIFALIHNIDSLLGAPIIPEERHRYSITQLLSDVLIRNGFEGVIYRSSVGNGINLCAFDPDTFDFDESASAVMKVDDLHYQFSSVDTSTPS